MLVLEVVWCWGGGCNIVGIVFAVGEVCFKIFGGSPLFVYLLSWVPIRSLECRVQGGNCRCQVCHGISV